MSIERDKRKSAAYKHHKRESDKKHTSKSEIRSGKPLQKQLIAGPGLENRQMKERRTVEISLAKGFQWCGQETGNNVAGHT